MSDIQQGDAPEASSPLDQLYATLERIFADFERAQRAAGRKTRDRREPEV